MPENNPYDALFGYVDLDSKPLPKNNPNVSIEKKSNVTPPIIPGLNDKDIASKPSSMSGINPSLMPMPEKTNTPEKTNNEFDDLFGDVAKLSVHLPERSSDISTIAGIGALGGAGLSLKYNKPIDSDVKNANLNVPPSESMTPSGLQRYINGHLPKNVLVTHEDLEKITGRPVRTPSEIQDALKVIKGSPAERVAKSTSIDPRTGLPKKIFSVNPAIPPVDLSPYTYKPTLASKATSFVFNKLPSVGRVGLGALGGAEGLSQGYSMLKDEQEKKPMDYTKLVSGLGSLASVFARPSIGVLGQFAQLPYAYKHRNELTKGLNMGDISSTAFMGMPEEQQPAFPTLPE